MFIAVRKYRVRRGATTEWAQRVRDGFVPLMREMAGFRGYYLLDGGPDVLIAISMFDSADEAVSSPGEFSPNRAIEKPTLRYVGDASNVA